MTTIDDSNRRYLAAMHAMQSGVAMEMQDPTIKATDPKHLRVGVNSAQVGQAALAQLLIARGIFTLDEYLEALAVEAEAEAERYRARLSAKLGIEVHLA
ncbi:hypothetical protein [Terrabacter terrigena]|uniref:Uncharacterized protein n=1 Tax=Terrabacter terrigena TaxID=574718 RepID=A0ABW3N0Z5_9MICO